MSIRTRILAAAVAVTGLIIGLGWGTLVLLDEERERLRLSNTNATLALEIEGAAREVQVAFKTQVQEWKNILLRGADKAAYDKYVKAFTTKEVAVRGALKKAQ